MLKKFCKECNTEVTEFKDSFDNVWIGCLNCDWKDKLKEIKENGN